MGAFAPGDAEDMEQDTIPPIHATCVVWRSSGILLRGPSGSGKSDLALRLIERGALLVADDLVRLTIVKGRLMASSVSSGAGLLEVRGVGILRFPYEPVASLRLCVDLVSHAEVPRLPEPASLVWGDVSLPMIALAAFDASTPAKITAWLDRPIVEGGCENPLG